MEETTVRFAARFGSARRGAARHRPIEESESGRIKADGACTRAVHIEADGEAF